MGSSVCSTVLLTAITVVATLGATPPALHAQAPTLPAAASGTIEGRVTAFGSDQPLEGVQVFVVGTTLGAATGTSGSYRIVGVPAREVELRTRMIGYAPLTRRVTVTAGETTRADFVLQVSALQLDQVVVTGSGGQVETKRLGNTISIIEPPPAAPITNMSELLQGREPGLVGLPSGGATGEGARIRIRGNASLSQSNEPIIFVDGIRINSGGGFGENVGAGGGGSPSRLDDIDPSTIERVEVLKGAAAATLYGTEASNGVIQIFTKRGAAGAPKWQFDLEGIASQYPKDRFPANAGYALRQSQADSLSVFYGRTIRPFEIITRNVPVENMIETGTGTILSGQVSGGTQAATYFLSGRYLSEDGPFGGSLGGRNLGIVQDLSRRIQGTATLAFEPRSNLRVGARSSWTSSFLEVPDNNNNVYGVISQAYLAKPEAANCIQSVRANPSTAPTLGVAAPGRCAGPGNPFGNTAFTTIAEAMQNTTNQDAQRFIGAVDATLSLPREITWTTTAGIDIVDQRNYEQRPFGHNVDRQISIDTLGSRTIDDVSGREITLDTKLNWNTNIRSNISSSLVIGAQGFLSRVVSGGGTARNFPGPGLEVVTAGQVQNITESFLSTVNGGFFAQQQLGFNDWIFTTLGGRYDYASAFGEEAPGVFYPKFSVSVVPSDLAGWQSTRLSTLRLRAAVGQSGRQPGAFDQFTTYAPINAPVGSGLVPLNLGNASLKPEVSTEIEGGFELGLLDNRFGIDVTGWTRTVDDALVAVQFAPSGGFTRQQLANVGKLDARGLEIALNGFAVNRANVQVNLFANAAYLWQRVTSLGGSPPIKVTAGGARYRNFLREGYAPGSLFGAEIARPCGQQPAGADYVCVADGQVPYDFNRDGVPDSEAEALAFLSDTISAFRLNPIQVDQNGNGDPLDHYLGKPVPDWSGSFGGTVTLFRNWRIYNLFEYKAGNFTVTNLTGAFKNALTIAGNSPRSARVQATLQNPASTPQQRLEAARLWANELKALTPYDGLNQNESGDFLRWRELGLTYTAPNALAGRVGASEVALTFSVRNLALFTRYSGLDPEITAFGRGGNTGVNANLNNNFAEAVDVFGLPLQRRYSLAVRLGF